MSSSLTTADKGRIALPFVTLDVFTSTPYTGNPLGVVLLPPEHHSLAQDVKQKIAKEFNLSETVFLHVPASPNSSEPRLDIFMTSAELPFAGHPCIGATSYLLLLGGGGKFGDDVKAMQIKAGRLPISRVPGVNGGGDTVQASVPHDVHLHERTLGSLLGSNSSDTTTLSRLSPDPTIRTAELSAPVISVVKGMSFTLTHLPSLDLLSRVQDGWQALSFPTLPLLDEGPWGSGFVGRYYYVILWDSPSSSSDDIPTVKLRTRLLEAGFEDPATGSAASALASFLAVSPASPFGDSTAPRIRFEMTQGVEMGRRSEIFVEVVRERSSSSSGWKVKELFLGGTAVLVMEGKIYV